ncbi:MAG: hypothetical protein ACI4PK_01920 [Oscillospiraceae bacterium]
MCEETSKNIITLLVIATPAGSIYFTINHAKNHIQNAINNTIQKEDKNIPLVATLEENTQKEATPQDPNKDSQNNSQTPPQKPNENKLDNNNSPNHSASNIKLTFGYYILFIAESFYPLFGFNLFNSVQSQQKISNIFFFYFPNNNCSRLFLY